MEKNLREAIKNRRSYYQINNTSPIADEEIESIISHVLMHAPSSFNSQSSRVVLLLGDNHKRLWEVTKAELKKVSVSEEAFQKTELRVDNSFAAGYGTVLFFEDQSIIDSLHEQFPFLPQKFGEWSEQSSAMVQIQVWMGFESVGLGMSLQHYNPLIDDAVRKEWNLDPQWNLIAQMPFGTPMDPPSEKSYTPIDEKLIVFK